MTDCTFRYEFPSVDAKVIHSRIRQHQMFMENPGLNIELDRNWKVPVSVDRNFTASGQVLDKHCTWTEFGQLLDSNWTISGFTVQLLSNQPLETSNDNFYTVKMILIRRS